MRFWSEPPHPDIARTQRLLDWMIAAEEPIRYFLVERDGAVVGTCGNHHGTEIGFMLARSQWGEGVMREAMEVVIPHLWAVTDHPRLTADADPRNLSSVALLTRLGFRVTGYARDTFHIAGEWSDSVYLGLDRPGAG